jgi:hypothetical protein
MGIIHVPVPFAHVHRLRFDVVLAEGAAKVEQSSNHKPPHSGVR